MKLPTVCLHLLLFLMPSILFAQIPPDSAAVAIADTARAARWVEEAKGLIEEGRPKASLELLEAAESVFERVAGRESRQVAEVLFEKGRCFEDLSDYGRSINVIREALAIFEKVEGGSSSEIEACCFKLGIGHFYQDDVSQGIFYLKRALELRRKIFGEIHSETAELHFILGFFYEKKRAYDDAIACLGEALNICLESSGGEQELLANIYHSLGVNYGKKGQYERAIEFQKKGLELQKRLFGEKHGDVARSHFNLGVSYSKKGEYAQATTHHEKALAIRLEVFGREDPAVAESYHQLAINSDNKGYYNKALEYKKKALGLYLKLFGENNLDVAAAYHNIGVSYGNKGDDDRAIEYFEKAMIIQIRLLGKHNPDVALTCFNLGASYDNKGDYERAVEYKKRALVLQIEAFGEKNIDVADTYHSLAGTYNNKGEYNKALLLYEKALAIRSELLGKSHPALALSYSDLGQCYYDQSNYTKAAETIQKALNIQLQTPENNHPEVATTHRRLALAFLKKGNIKKAEYHLGQSLRILTYRNKGLSSANSNAQPAKTLQSIGSLQREKYINDGSVQNLLQSQKNYLKALSSLDHQSKTLSPAGRSTLAKEAAEVYNGALLTNHLLYQLTDSLHYLAESFELAERSKAFLLYEAMQESDALAFAGLPDSLLEREYDLRIDLAYYDKKRQEKLSEGLSETDSAVLAVSSKLFGLNREYEALKRRLESDYPDYYRLKYSLGAVSLAYVQDTLLQPGETLLEYVVGDSAIFAFVVRRDHFELRKLPRDALLKEKVASMRKGISAYHTSESPTVRLQLESARRYAEAAHALYDQLIAPVAGLLTEKVIIIPDGVLGYLPFEALLMKVPANPLAFDTHPYLLHEHQASYCYSATLLKEMRQRRHYHEPSREFLAFAPYYDGDTTLLGELFAYTDAVRKGLDPLPHTGEEAYLASRLFDGDYYVGAAATEQRFTELAGDYRILHLATHGQANDEVGDYSFLAFSEIRDSLENELLYVRDLYNLRLNASLAVLSACETGIGELQRGEGIISLARAFAYAGAESIVTTLWQVDDARSKGLALTFYKGLREGLPKDAALRQAKRKLIKDGMGHPFFWAGFIVAGDARKLY